MGRLAVIHPKDKAKNSVVTDWMLMGLRHLIKRGKLTDTDSMAIRQGKGEGK